MKNSRKLLKLLFDILKYVVTALAGYFSNGIIN